MVPFRPSPPYCLLAGVVWNGLEMGWCWLGWDESCTLPCKDLTAACLTLKSLAAAENGSSLWQRFGSTAGDDHLLWLPHCFAVIGGAERPLQRCVAWWQVVSQAGFMAVVGR